MDDLVADGWSCEKGGLDSYVCTKPGQKDYYCDGAGKCTQLRRSPVGPVRPPKNIGPGSPVF